jgi:hypothetical protein
MTVMSATVRMMETVNTVSTLMTVVDRVQITVNGLKLAQLTIKVMILLYPVRLVRVPTDDQSINSLTPKRRFSGIVDIREQTLTAPVIFTSQDLSSITQVKRSFTKTVRVFALIVVQRKTSPRSITVSLCVSGV